MCWWLPLLPLVDSSAMLVECPFSPETQKLNGACKLVLFSSGPHSRLPDLSLSLSLSEHCNSVSSDIKGI